MIQRSLAQGKVFQSCRMNDSTRCLLKPSREVYAQILKLHFIRLNFFPYHSSLLPSDFRKHFNNPRLLLVSNNFQHYLCMYGYANNYACLCCRVSWSPQNTSSFLFFTMITNNIISFTTFLILVRQDVLL